MAAVLKVDGIHVDYDGVRAVRDVSFAVDAGEAVAILGANGAGKTSILRAVSRLVPLSAGNIRVAGEDVAGDPPEEVARRGVAHVPADRGIFPSLSVSENLRTSLYGAGLDGTGAADEALSEVFELFPILDERRDQAAGTMSGGQQQMLTLARALVQQPKILMIDEMSMGLAPNIVADLFDAVSDLTHRGLAVVVVEQFVDQALSVVDRAFVLEQGRVVADGTPSELRESNVADLYLGGGGEHDVLADVDLSPAPNRATETVPVTVSPARLRRLEQLAQDDGGDPSAIAQEAVERYLREQDDSEEGAEQ